MRYRPDWLAEGADVLIAELESNRSAGKDLDFDVAIIGSGYGGAVAAARLARVRSQGDPLKVCLLERGREYVPGTFPSRFSELPGHVRFSRYDDPKSKGPADGLFDFRIGADMSLLLGNGLGGGSLINGSVAERPNPDVFADAAWPEALRRDPAGLRTAFELAEEMLGVEPADTRNLRKYKALEDFARAIGASVKPARIAVRSSDGVNQQGVSQSACNRCGDCITGCNFWAKNTLGMNYLAEAKRYEARLFTNATVSHLKRVHGCWFIYFRLTVPQHPLAEPSTDTAWASHAVRAKHVVLAAGSLGSTEILMRSRARGLRVSAELGKRFSGNGDMISVLYGGNEEVNAAPEESAAFSERGVGPTITGIVEAGASRAERVVIEEFSIPAPLRRIFEEVITTAALPVELAKADRSTHASNGPDPAAVDPRAVRHSQIFGAMGDDGARGHLEMVDGWESVVGSGTIRIRWEDAGLLPVYERQDALLLRSEGDGGTYLRNPLWKPLPDALADMLSGPKPSGKLFSVHPLGGCPMGDDAAVGVVDDMGRVFDPSSDGNDARTHDGLLVLDGSIVPVALSINPLLTIAALAERAIANYIALQDWTTSVSPPPARLPPTPLLPTVTVPAKSETAVRFAEKMTGKLALSRGAIAQDAVLKVEFDVIGPIPEFLRDGPHRVQIANANLSMGNGDAIPLSGSVYWMERGRTRYLGRVVRAIWTWLWSRGIADFFQRARERGYAAAIKTLFRGGSILALASRVGERRYLRYELEVPASAAGRQLPPGTRIRGLKTFHYVHWGNPLKQLSQLAVTVTPPGGTHFNAGNLSIDPLYLLQRFAAQFQVVHQLDQPTAIMDVASIGLFMTRIAFKVHFWSFRAPEYEAFDPDRARRRLPGPLDPLHMERHTVRILARGGSEPILLPLTRYSLTSTTGRDRSNPVTPVVLFHGFGASGAQFAHPKLNRNLVRHLAEKRGDVWVAELRTSIAVASSYNQWTLDDVATEDIPAIIDQVVDVTGCTAVDVVAHCIGSAMFCTAVLAGRLAGRVRRAALLQVGPLITLSKGNQFRGYVAAALRRYMLTDHVDSSVDRRADWVNVTLDRLLGTYPYPDSETRAHTLWPWCKPHTHIANCNRSAAVFGRLFQHANVDETLLDALGDLLGHTNLTTFEQTVQYAFVRRLTDYDACNSYVTDRQVGAHFRFPVLFLHGTENDVFDPETTVRSRELLQEVFGLNHPAFREVIEGYGHLDPLIGRNAEVDVFVRISAFLARDGLAPATGIVDREARYVRPPLIGPILGWTRKEGGLWIARIWCRTDDEQSYARFLLAVVLKDGHPVPGYAFSVPLQDASGSDELGSLDLLGVVDVPLPHEASGDYEIVILGAHSSTRSNMPEGVTEPDPVSVPGRHDVAADMKDAVELEVGRIKALEDKYGEIIAEIRRTKPWVDEANESATARRVCDPGYQGRVDSVILPRKLLNRLESDSERIDFALASCRYAASLLDREQADAMFGRLRDLIDSAEPEAPAPSLLLLAGDQIYADATAGMFDPKSRRGRFHDAYREAWTAPNVREVLRRLPVYMMIDDHEVQDEWHPQDSDGADGQRMRNWGLIAFEEHQLAHSPRGLRRAQRRLHTPQTPYHYAFESGGFPFFACDTRTDRQGRSHIMSDPQFSALEHWLSSHRNDTRPKFVLSPSILVPFLHETCGASAVAAMRSDDWDGFPQSLRRLFGFIADNDIDNVVFLCGDPHFAMTSEFSLERTGRSTLRGLCIIGSPLYAPYPFANDRPIEFLHSNVDNPLDAGAGGSVRYRVDAASIVQGDSFSLVGAERRDQHWSVTVSVYGKSGAPRVRCYDLA